MKTLEKLVHGYKRFLDADFKNQKKHFHLLAERGQSPKIMVIGCCDSRVNPDLIFNSSPGDLFVVRNVANLIPPYAPDENHHSTSAAIEFAVTVLKVDHIIILGHSRCGGVKACCDALNGEPTQGDFLPQWTSLLQDCAKKVQSSAPNSGEFVVSVEKAGIIASLDNLNTFPFVRDAVKERGMLLHGAYFDVSNGQLYAFDEANNDFLAVE